MSAAPVAQVSNLSPVQRVSNPLDVFTPTAKLEQLDPIAQNLAEQNTPESIQTLLNGIEKIKDWPTRAALAKNLRAVTNPETLQTLLPPPCSTTTAEATPSSTRSATPSPASPSQRPSKT